MPYYVEKKQTWRDNWHDIIRYVLFQDSALKQLMVLPEGTTITQFIDKYFIQNPAGSQLLTDEKVRIMYYDSDGGSTGNKNVTNKYKQFEVYVSQDVLRTADKDKLKSRYELIQERLKYLILNNCLKYGLRFQFKDSYNLWTKTQGYLRWHIVFSYKTTH